jgi:hypothetical protein
MLFEPHKPHRNTLGLDSFVRLWEPPNRRLHYFPYFVILSSLFANISRNRPSGTKEYSYTHGQIFLP